MSRQYVAVQFQPWDRRTYTYHNDGAPLAPDDQAIVITDRGETKVTVVSVSNQAPEFVTKPVSRAAEPSQPPAQGRPATAGAEALQAIPAPAGKELP